LFLSRIEPLVLTRNVFDLAPDCETTHELYILRGMICYKPEHYIACFYNPEAQHWVEFNDSKVKRKFSWKHLCKRLLEKNFAPVLLFFEASEPYC
jgi:hypothetical protein